ncbi:hypothetical protein ABEY82_15200 [Priestia megaterium]
MESVPDALSLNNPYMKDEKIKRMKEGTDMRKIQWLTFRNFFPLPFKLSLAKSRPFKAYDAFVQFIPLAMLDSMVLTILDR